MKTAILLIGNIRTFEHCKDNFKNTFGNIDVFVSTYNLKYDYHPAVKSKINDYSDEIISPNYVNELLSGLNVKSSIIEDSYEVNEYVKRENSNLHPSLQNIHSSYAQYRKLKTSTELVIEYENKFGFKYDSLIRSRFDLLYNNFDSIIEEKELIHSTNIAPNHEFLSDQFFYTNRNDMINISNFIMNEFYNPVYEDSNQSPPHGLLKNAIKYNNLKKTFKPMVKSMLRKNGQEEVL